MAEFLNSSVTESDMNRPCAEGSSVKGSGEMIRVSAPWAQGVRVVL